MRKICQTILALILMSVSMHVMSQEYRIPLYSGSIPNSKPGNGNERIEKQEITVISNVQVPEIAVYLPTKRFATGQAVVRPDIMVLMYPVISFADGITHLGSREALLGKNP
ncbi:MAG: hypothetical protein JXR41_09235, partial [Bacteroidales bacterium]|nr:hypothetical protein [Bacteroidales bacterium]